MATAPVSLALNAEELAAVTFIDFLDRAGIDAITAGPVAGSVTAPRRAGTGDQPGSRSEPHGAGKIMVRLTG